MAQAPLDKEAFDRSAYVKADAQFRLASKRLPQGAIEALAREVVLRLAFRMPRMLAPDKQPSAAEIAELCAALLSDDDEAADKIILAAQRDGADLDALYLGHVAGAASRLGDMWDSDQLSFLQVTLACARLYRIIRGLRHIISPSVNQGRDTRPALFMLAPGETHTLGIEIATDVVRQEGWDVDMLVGLDHDALVAQSEQRQYRAIVIVAHSDIMLEPVTRLALALRIAQPTARLVVAGHLLDHHSEVEELVGADAVIKDIPSAVATLEAVMEPPSREG